MPDRIENFKVVCRGGLNSNENSLDLSDNNPGAAVNLVNYEPSLYGGYRRIDGYEEYDDLFPYVGGDEAEGKVLGVAMFRDEGGTNKPFVIAARKDLGADTYSFWRHTPFVGWEKMTLPEPRQMTDGVNTVSKIRHVQANFMFRSFIVFVDGVNPAIGFDGGDWYVIKPSHTGTEESPGGDQALVAPAIAEVFQNHLFLGGDYGASSVIAHSAPNAPYDFSVANGGGQLTIGFPVVNFKPFRDDLYVFGATAIKKVTPDLQAAFLLESVTANVGCVARDSVVEIGGDLMFLAPDGFRPVAGTSRIGDVELETVSRPIQSRLLEIIAEYPDETINAVVLRKKRQVRVFFGDNEYLPQNSIGVIGGMTTFNGQLSWEFGETIGIRASCATSEYIGRDEYVLHGDFDGRVFRQERGTTFDGRDITSIFTTPYLDFGDTEIRKVFHRINTFLRPEGPVTMNLAISYDWSDGAVATPAAYQAESRGSPVRYGNVSVLYAGEDTNYGGASKPIMLNNIQGSGYSVQLTYVSSGNFKSHSIQGIVLEFGQAGKR